MLDKIKLLAKDNSLFLTILELTPTQLDNDKFLNTPLVWYKSQRGNSLAMLTIKQSIFTEIYCVATPIEMLNNLDQFAFINYSAFSDVERYLFKIKEARVRKTFIYLHLMLRREHEGKISTQH